jgi:cystathionine beta-synthase
VTSASQVRQALNLMSTWGVSQLPVVDGGTVVGGLAEATLSGKALAQPALLLQPVRDVMDPPFPVVDADTPLDHLGTVLTNGAPAAVVRQGERLAGIVSRYDLLQELIGR